MPCHRKRAARLAPAALMAGALVAGGAAPAQPVSGTLTGRLDQNAATWTVARGDGDTRSGWQQTEAGREITLAAFAGMPEEEPGGTLTLRFLVPDGAREAFARDVRVALSPADGGRRDWIAEGENVDFSLTAFEVEDGSIAVAGNVVARLTEGGADGLVVGDSGLTLDGNFQATVVRRRSGDAR